LHLNGSLSSPYVHDARSEEPKTYNDMLQQSLSALGYYFMLSDSMAIELKFIFMLLEFFYFMN